MLARLRAAALAAATLLLPAVAAARPFTVDDLLHQESFGNVAVDPTGRWIAIERRDPFDTAPAFDGDQQTPTLTSRVLIIDLHAPGPARPLLRPDPGAGVVLAAFSPSGARLAVYRLQGHRFTLGVVDLPSGQVRWLPVTPELSMDGRSLQWLSDRELLVIDRPDGVPSWPLRWGHTSADALPRLWADSASGAGAHTVLGSGAYRDLRARPTPRRLLRIDVATGSMRTLATGELEDLEVSPDGRRVALREAGDDLQPKADQTLQGDYGLDTHVHRLVLVDLSTGDRTAACPGCDVLPHLLAWSPDGRSLLVFARGAGQPWTAGRLLRLSPTAPPRDAAPGLLPLVEGRPVLVGAGWMGDAPVVLARDAAHPEGRADWRRVTKAGSVNLTEALPDVPRNLAALAPEGLTAVVANVAWQLDPSGRAKRLAGTVTAVSGPRTWSEDRLFVGQPRRSWVLTGPPEARFLHRLDARGIAPGIPLPGGEPTFVAAADGVALLRREDWRGPAELLLARSSAPTLTVSTVNAGLADTNMPRIVPVAHKGPNGETLTSWLFLPASPKGGAPPPLVVKAYSGNIYRTPPRDNVPVLGLVTDVRTLLGHGYAVLVPSLPAPRPRGEPMAGLGERILAVVDAAAARPDLAGAFDPHRLALWGHSFGGYTVAAALAQTDRFSAAVSISAPSDLLGMWGSVYPALRTAPEDGVWTAWIAGWVETSQGEMGGPPWIDPARYARNSPLLAADRIRTPLLLFHGDQDNIPLTQSEAMFSALYRQDKDAILVNYWGEGHHIQSPGNIRDLWSRAFDFLDEQLQPTKPGTVPPRAPNGSTG